MTSRASCTPWLGLLGSVLACLPAPALAADAVPRPPLPLHDPPLLGELPSRPAVDSSLAPRAPRVRLLRMPSTFLSEPVGLGSEGEPPPPDEPLLPAGLGDGEPGRLVVTMGEDNPFFDFRRRGTPGGVGFYRLHTQLQLFDTGTTGWTLACQAVTPAGVEFNGLNDGPTYLSPAVTVFHDLGEGTALHGFVGQDVPADSRWRDHLGRGLQYGLAVQQPLAAETDRGLFLFLEALGRYRLEEQALHTWELLPGLHYRMSEDWWLSGGLIVPVGPVRAGSGQWHITCSWQF